MDARFEPRRITDVRRCLAVEGGGDGRVGVQCRRKPRKGRMMCARHRTVEDDVPSGPAATFAEARRQAALLARPRRRR